MSSSHTVSRRKFLQSVDAGIGCGVVPGFARIRHSVRSFLPINRICINAASLLEEFGYGEVTLDSPLHEQQLQQTHDY